ncbi:hypothetical protein SSTU70S_01013 [Stutzerimonas stutzeri]
MFASIRFQRLRQLAHLRVVQCAQQFGGGGGDLYRDGLDRLADVPVVRLQLVAVQPAVGAVVLQALQVVEQVR